MNSWIILGFEDMTAYSFSTVTLAPMRASFFYAGIHAKLHSEVLQFNVALLSISNMNPLSKI